MDSAQSTVSVILPAFNAEKYIYDSVESILKQTHRNIELVIINDGSTDDTAKIISSFSDHRIFLHTNEKNLGLIESLNRGLKYAKGEFIARMDADDISMPQRIAVQLDFLSQHKTDIVGTGIEKIGNSKGFLNYPETDAEIKVRLLFGNPIVHPSVLFRRDLVDKGDYYYSPDYKHVEDYELWTRLMDSYTFANLQLPLLKYRSTEDSVCFKNNNEQEEKNKGLRVKVLHKIDPAISCSPVEEKWLASSNAKYTVEEMKHLAGFIIKLNEANKGSRYFSKSKFPHVLSDRYLSTCLVNNDLRQGALNLYIDLLKELGIRKKTEPILRLFAKGIIRSIK